MKILRISVSVALSCLSLPLHAAEPVIEPSDSIERTVILQNGAVYRGEVVELEPHRHVILRLASGGDRRFEWRDLRRITGAGATTPARSRGGGEKVGSQVTRSPAASEPAPAEKLREPSRSAASYREHLNDAKTLEEQGLLSEALAHYEQAYARNPQSVVLYRMASLHDQLDHPKQALSLYRRYLAQNPNIPEERQSEVANNIARLRSALQEEPPARREPLRIDVPASGATQLRSPGMLAAGISIWATSYMAAVVTGSLLLAGSTASQVQRGYSASTIGQVQAAAGVLLIPVAGPFVSSGLIPSLEWTLPWIFVGGGTQILGMALTIAGGRRRPAYGGSAQTLVLPTLSPHSTGLAVAGSF